MAFETVFEVHYWPVTGRILVVHIPGTGLFANEPILTELHITGERGSADLKDATYLIALALSDAGTPAGGLVEHDASGKVHVNRESGKWQKLTAL